MFLLELSQNFVLIDIEFDLIVFVLLDLVLKVHVKRRRRLESHSHLMGNPDIHDDDVLEVDSKLVELRVEVRQHISRQLALNVPDFADFYGAHEVSNRLFTFSFKHFLESGWPEVVNKVFAIFLSISFFSNVKINSDVN